MIRPLLLLLAPAMLATAQETLVTRQLEAVGATLAVPADWHLREDDEEGVRVYQFTREKLDAPGDSFLVGVTLSVTPDVPGRAEVSPSQYAADLLAFAVEDGGGKVVATEAPPFRSFRAEYSVEGDRGRMHIVDVATANDSTGTLYFLAWQCPEAENDALAGLREQILSSLVPDPKK